MAVLAVGLGLSVAWAPGAQAAGNVQVSVVAGDLIIRGDDLGNNIFVSNISSSFCLVTGRANTTINGGTDCFEGDTVADDIDIRMAGGDDFVRVEAPATIPNDLKIDTGLGHDLIELLQVRVADLTQIITGGGNDTVFIDGVLSPSGFIRSDFGHKVTLNTGGNNDFVEIHNAVFRDAVAVTLGSGNDGLCSTASEYRNQTLGQVTFDGGGGVETYAINPLAGTIINFEGEDDDCSFNGGRPF
jgi:hypothetical protein